MQRSDPRLYPAFLKLAGLPVVVVGGGTVAASKLDGLVDAGARVTVIAPAVSDAIRARASSAAIAILERGFVAGDLDGARWVVAAATPEVNRAVAAAAAERGLFVNAVDDVASASAYLGAVVTRGPVLLAISTGGIAPALAGLLREALEAVLPDDLARWIDVATAARADWKRAGTPISERRPLLLRALDRIYARNAGPSDARSAGPSDARSAGPSDARSAGPSDARSAGPSDARNAGPTDARSAGPSDARNARPTDGRNAGPTDACVHGRSAGGDVHAALRAGSVVVTGFVSLVGAGPGDPELLTLRALRRLREADLVLNDALVHTDLLELAPTAQRFYVGKRAGRHSIDQAGIHHLMIRAARRGQRVVRLKAGDPFVFGRGGEEALALEAAGIAYEVVPGLSSATAAPLLAGIPLTHRGIASGFAVVSGHAEAAYAPILDGIAPNALTLVVLMGVAQRAQIAARLIARGWPAATPAALLFGASQPGSITQLVSLSELAAGSTLPDTELPAVLVIGEVVSLAEVIGHVTSAPLAERSL